MRNLPRLSYPACQLLDQMASAKTAPWHVTVVSSTEAAAQELLMHGLAQWMNEQHRRLYVTVKGGIYHDMLLQVRKTGAIPADLRSEYDRCGASQA